MKSFQFTAVKVGGMGIGMLTSVQENEGPALSSVLVFISAKVSRLRCYQASCQSTNLFKDLKVHHQLCDGGNARPSAGDARAVTRPTADLSQPLRRCGEEKETLQCAGVGEEDTRGRRGEEL